MTAQKNADGLLVRFGSDQGKRGTAGRAGVVRTSGKTDQMILEVDLTGAARTIVPTDTDGDGVLDGFVVGLDTPIPAGTLVRAAYVVTETAPAGGTSYAVNTSLANGTIDVAGGLIAAGGAAGSVIGTVLAADRFVSVTTVGTYTAGKLKIVVDYVRP